MCMIKHAHGCEAICACCAQNSVGTLMNIADDPTQVSGGGTWRVNDTLRRIPIILTGEPSSICTSLLTCSLACEFSNHRLAAVVSKAVTCKTSFG